jgi:hypothetical protein
MFCRNCGGPLKPEAQFCPHCGAATIEPAASGGGDAAPKPGAVAAAPTTRAVRVPMTAPHSRRTTAMKAALIVLTIAILAVLAYLGLAWRRSSPALAANGCDDEPVAHSVNGAVDDMLTVTNLTASPIEVHWLNFEGAREKHFDVAPQGTRQQRTPKSYPWVITTQSGQCLRMVSVPGAVMIKE